MYTPEVERISRLIDALRECAINSARKQYEEHAKNAYSAPDLASWDAFAWFELAQDWKLVDFLLSDSRQACRLRRGLQSLFRWYGQNELDEIIEQKRLLSIMN